VEIAQVTVGDAEVREHLRPGVLLPRVDLVAQGVQPGGGVVGMDPRVHRRDLHAIGGQAHRDAVVQQHPVGRAARAGRVEVLVRREVDTAAHRLEPVDVVLGDEWHVRHHPAKIFDRDLGVDRLEAGDLGLEIGAGDRVHLGTPAGPGCLERGRHPDVVPPA
jgi:hypothetical protein